MTIAPPRVLSVNVGTPRTVRLPTRTITTAIWKAPVRGRVAARGHNLEGDAQADRSVHGGPHKAVYAYALEERRWWEAEVGRELEPGCFGQNLDVDGLELGDARVGERWAVGSAVLEVSEPRLPCFKLGLRMGDPGFLRRFAEAGRPGAYLRIVAAGELAAGDRIEVLERPDHTVTMKLMARAQLEDHGLAERLLEAPALSPGWRAWAEEQAARNGRGGTR